MFRHGVYLLLLTVVEEVDKRLEQFAAVIRRIATTIGRACIGPATWSPARTKKGRGLMIEYIKADRPGQVCDAAWYVPPGHRRTCQQVARWLVVYRSPNWVQSFGHRCDEHRPPGDYPAKSVREDGLGR
jgi:hypothetical protein